MDSLTAILFSPLPIDVMLGVIVFWIALGVLGLFAPLNLRFVGHVLFPLGAVGGLILAGAGLVGMAARRGDGRPGAGAARLAFSPAAGRPVGIFPGAAQVPCQLGFRFIRLAISVTARARQPACTASCITFFSPRWRW